MDLGTSYEVLSAVSSGETMTRISKGVQLGDLWDRVILESGIVGYAFQTYLEEVPKVQISRLTINAKNTTINKGETITADVQILPEEAINNTVIFESSDNTVIIVDDKGNITGVGGGSATVTVKSENGSVSNSINIIVYSPITEIYIDSESVTVQEGNEFKLNAIIAPDDASNKNIIWDSSDTSIATIDSFGKIVGIAPGLVTITATSEDNGKQKSIIITIIEKVEEGLIVLNESLTVNESLLSGIDIKNNNVSNLKDKITTDFNIQIYNSNGTILSDTDRIGTGSKVVFRNDNDVVVNQYNVIVYGDVNGDGKINSVDLLVLRKHILEIQRLEGVFLKAGNTFKNGKNPTSVDSLIIQKHILEISLISQ